MSINVKELARMWLLEAQTLEDMAEHFGKSTSAMFRLIDKHGLKGEKGNARLYADLFRDIAEESGELAHLRPVEITVPKRKATEFDSVDHVQVAWSDVQFPFEDKRAMSILYQVTEDLQPSILTCLGDIPDFHQISDYRPALETKLKPDQINLQSTIEKTVEHLGIMESLAQPDADKYYEMGNHEDRWERLLAEIQTNPKTRHLLMMPRIAEVLNLDYLLGLSEHGWEWTEYMGGNHTMLFDRLLITHGHKSNKWVARSLMEDFDTNVMFGHSHRIQNFTRNGVHGQKAGWNIGCLCDVNPHWRPQADWAQGFAVVTWKNTSEGWLFGVEQLRIHEGHCIFRDRSYTA